ncbi:Uu.00g115150.m01.CDS01 [Anthostomella pinea]|uniref:Uu.00g115150.m01.CDS01 n=1 Tax=Anthostomella pinea TaxID=933095 RepID=A0AAI8VGI0_9PEZI|nr:Uu.00g115150.m01.CDS01 [Anthostomella pinea]
MMSAQLQQSDAGAAASSQPSQSTNEAQAQRTQSFGPLTNRAASSKSPFVRANSESAIAWQLLDDEAISRAKGENKPIFLSIGYLASHHCHLAHQETFSNPKIASLLNQEFVPILIDREEYPNIDSVYMSYNQSLNSNAGWPLNVFLTPELEPVYSGTYWAPPGTDGSVAAAAAADGAAKPLDWLTVIEKVHSSWQNEESRVRAEAQKSLIELQQLLGEGTLVATERQSPAEEITRSATDYSAEIQGEVDLDQLEEAYERITRTFDPVFGGFGQADKFLTPPKLSLILRATQFPQVVQDVVGPEECVYISTMGLHTLRRIVTGAVHDHIGGGFHRHSITRDWSLPSFEKLLIDNALLLGLFLDAWLLSGGQPQHEFADTVTEVADYITSDTMVSEKGGFFTSEVADSYNRRGDKVMRNGAFYLWTRKEFDTAVGNEDESKTAAAYWNVQEHGNVDSAHDPLDEFLNQNVIHIVKNHTRLSKQLVLTEEEVKRRIDSAKAKLRSYRQAERVKPDVDTKIVTSYNGMAIAALSRTAAAIFDKKDPATGKREKYLTAAKNAALFIKNELWDSSEKTLYRMYCDGRSDVKAFSEDYAFLIEGLIELYEASADASWLEWADELQAVQITLFYDQPTTTPTQANARCGAFYSTTHDAPYTLLCYKDAMDSSQPSANAVSVSNLFRLGALLSDEKYTYLAKESLNAFAVEMLEHPNLFPGLLCGIVPWKLGGRHWVCMFKDEPDRHELAGFYKAPRSALFTVRYHTGDEPHAWIRRRDPGSETFRRANAVYMGGAKVLGTILPEGIITPTGSHFPGINTV